MFFLELSCFFYGPTYVVNLTSVSSAFSKPSLNIWKFSVYENFMNCWRLAWRILSITMFVVRWVQSCSSLSILWHCLSLGLEWKLTFFWTISDLEETSIIQRKQKSWKKTSVLIEDAGRNTNQCQLPWSQRVNNIMAYDTLKLKYEKHLTDTDN